MRDFWTKSLAFIVFMSRFALPAAYLTTVWWVLVAIQSRPVAPLLTSSRDLPQFHKIVADDLLVSVAGKFLLRDIKKGDAIDAAAVSDKAPVPKAARNLAHDHKLVTDDLDPPGAPAVVGKYLTKDVTKGDALDPGVLTDKPPASETPTKSVHKQRSSSRGRSRRPHR